MAEKAASSGAGSAPWPDTPPHGSAQAPPRDHASLNDAQPTTAMLKADIDSGRTGDKNEVFDPGLSPLGTDEEAGGTPLKPEQIRQARLDESKRRWRFGPSKTSAAHDKGDSGTLGLYIGLIVAVALVITAGLYWLR